MTLFDILFINREFLARLREAGARLDDIDHIDLFSDFAQMVAGGDKVSYAVEILSEKYAVSVRTIYSMVKRFKKPLQL